MKLIKFTFKNIFDFKSVMDTTSPVGNRIHSSNSDKLIIVFRYKVYAIPYINFVNSICTPTNIEELHE